MGEGNYPRSFWATLCLFGIPLPSFSHFSSITKIMRPSDITRVTWLVASDMGHEWNSLYLPSPWNLPTQSSGIWLWQCLLVSFSPHE